MNPIEISLIIIGIIVIIISCVVVDQSQKAPGQVMGKSLTDFTDRWSEEDKKQLMDKLKELLSELSEDTIAQTETSLGKISNEKIMAVNEFSDQIIEKIKRNHEEVVFLYNMLNDKEKELKLTVREIDSSKKDLQEILHSRGNGEKNQIVKSSKPQAAAKASVQDMPSPADKPKGRSAPTVETSSVLYAKDGSGSNNNSQILSLHSQGKSIVEISKLLGLGQGEVKLVIDLYKGKK